jgi:hypothetical protein
LSPQKARTQYGSMEPYRETGFPAILSRWLREITLSRPEAARTTIVELIIEAMLTGGGHVMHVFWR